MTTKNWNYSDLNNECQQEFDSAVRNHSEAISSFTSLLSTQRDERDELVRVQKKALADLEYAHAQARALPALRMLQAGADFDQTRDAVVTAMELIGWRK